MVSPLATDLNMTRPPKSPAALRVAKAQKTAVFWRIDSEACCSGSIYYAGKGKNPYLLQKLSRSPKIF